MTSSTFIYCLLDRSSRLTRSDRCRGRIEELLGHDLIADDDFAIFSKQPFSG